jgi:hypothetical protein
MGGAYSTDGRDKKLYKILDICVGEKIVLERNFEK